MTPDPVLPPTRAVPFLAALCLLPLACSGGENRPIVRDTITATLVQDPPPQTDGVVFFDNVVVSGDNITTDVVVRDTTGTLDLDSVDVVLRYDATFLQVLSFTGQNTLFGTCNTLNATCGLVSPVCASNRSAANGGGAAFCRSNGSTFCSTDTDCTAPGDACGSWGVLEGTLAVLTGPTPRTCSGAPGRTCNTDADCQYCQGDPSIGCIDPTPCGGSICFQDTCSGCPSVVVSGTQLLANVTLRVLRAGSSEIRFVVSSNPSDIASFARKDLTNLPVLFFPNVDAADPAIKTGSILVQGVR